MEGDCVDQDRLGHLFLKPQGLSQPEEGAIRRQQTLLPLNFVVLFLSQNGFESHDETQWLHGTRKGGAISYKNLESIFEGPVLVLLSPQENCPPGSGK